MSVPVSVVEESVAIVVLPSVPRTMLLLPELGFLRFVADNGDIRSALVQNVDGAVIERVGAVDGGDADAV